VPKSGLTVIAAGDAHSTRTTDEGHATDIVRRQNLYLKEQGARIETVPSIVAGLSS